MHGPTTSIVLQDLVERPLLRQPAAADTALIVVNTSVPGWPIVYANSPWATSIGLPADAIVGNRLWDMYRNAASSQVPKC